MSVVLLGPSRTQVKTRQPRSIRIKHRTKRLGIALVPIYKIPFKGLLRECVTCKVTHKVKTIHLTLGADGTCLVSEGVLESLKLAGMPNLDYVADIVNPPPIRITGNRLGLDDEKNSRLAVDAENNKITILKEPVIV